VRHFIAGLSRSGRIAIVALCAVMAAGGLAAATLIGTGDGARTADGASASRTTASGTRDVAAAGMPQVVATPQPAAMPKTAKSAGSSGAKSAGHGTSAQGSGGHTPGSAGTGSGSTPPSGGASTQPPVPAGTTSCTHPSFVTSDQYGMWHLDPYFVYNNMWDIAGYQVSQTLYACSYSNWYVVATMNNNNGDGHVKTYPNSQKDFSSPRISGLSSVTSTFAETSPGTGIYEDAYDIWLNGVATSGSTEVMIWNDNHHQSPAGSVQGTVTFDGRSYTVWRTGTYIAFVANANFTSGTMNLLEFFKWLMSKGWIPGSSTLGQVCYGVELVSTNGAPATFSFSNFSVTAS
jgi:hypothetical protein